jgi:methyltransferase (TIGR00027 family)
MSTLSSVPGVENTPEPRQISRTSIMVAAARAFGARDPDPSIRNPDWLAEHLLGPAELELIKEHPLSRALDQDYREASREMFNITTTSLMLIRTRFIDEKLAEAVRGGAEQVVILGAGFDTRAFRLHELLKDASVFEIDAPATQECKRRRIDTVLGAVPPNVTYASIDFHHHKLNDVLSNAGYSPDRKTFFIWEGVNMYLREESVRETLLTVSRGAAPGSSLVMDYAGAGMIEMMSKIPAGVSALNFLGAWGEPWLFGVPEGKEREFFAENGLEVSEIFSMYGPEIYQRYLTRRDGSVFGVIPGMPRPDMSEMMKAWAAAAQRGSLYALALLSVPSRTAG